MAADATANGLDRSATASAASPGLANGSMPADDSSAAPAAKPKRERFIPVTRFALMDRLTRAKAWAPGEAARARRFLRYLAYWRSQQYGKIVLDLEQTYEPFSPDSDLLMTRKYTDAERLVMQKRFVTAVEGLLKQANYDRIDPAAIQLIMTKDSHYGLDLHVDLEAFEELLIYTRGASTRRDEKRTFAKFFRKQEYDVPIFRRLFILFKLKDEETRIEEIRKSRNVTRKEAKRIVTKLRAGVPEQVLTGNIFIKAFKDMPRADIEMVFPNTRVKFRLKDKIKLGVTSGAGAAMGVASAAGKIALAASNPFAAAGAAAGLGGLAFRQFMGFMNQRQKYMVVMAQNLYFHALADNRGALIKLADRAAEEDVKEEFLLYSVLAKEVVHRSELHAVDVAIEHFLLATFGIDVDFDVEDALSRLIRDGIVREDRDGYLHALPPADAARRIDTLWDSFLDDLPDMAHNEGEERAGDSAAPPPTATPLVVLGDEGR